ncbi:hypothetical protein N6H18_09255 [Reichenbachiella agarivorans]|uniref:Uncharacterized protein n=1 Tax=Reichenbachiella agarivorans TaxID=2979464 RepID=A0ABY6CUD3_9BACT|nr:hypothetical protein [Reichenbachiella agarivorans]UXP34130.1 hypothetical protein N6H18_09255 [Reichenbachiella agarivorans]
MSEELVNFITEWQSTMYVLAPSAVVLGVLIYTFYRIRLASKSELKAKYDFVSKYEYKYLFATHIAIGIGVFFICNTYKQETVLLSFVWFFIRLFISMCFGVLYAYVAKLMLTYYYPSVQAKKLKIYRYTPRVNSKNGNEMKLLSEEEEDAYLDEGMQAEEDVFSVDYDVWIDTETGDTRIEKYEGRLSALECDRCGFQTLKLEKEEISKEASADHEGELIKHYKCSYCKRIKRKTVKLSTEKNEDDFHVTEKTQFIDLTGAKKVILVKVALHSNEGEIKNYEFQNLHEAQKFLREFSFKKLEE